MTKKKINRNTFVFFSRELFFLNRKKCDHFFPPKFPPINIHRGKNKLRNFLHNFCFRTKSESHRRIILVRFDPSGLPYQHDDKRLL